MKKRKLEDYTPELLGKDFINVVVLSDSPRYYETFRKEIEQNFKEILSYFKQHQTLNGLELANIRSPKTMKYLGMVLEHGVKKSRAILKEREILKEQKPMIQHTIYFKPNQEPPPHWDNCIRILEGD